MKLTDFALIFVGILLPIVIIVYVNTAFVVKAEKQEMYYKNLMNSAVLDAVSSMKQVENDDADIDYGYSGIVDNKVSINTNLAISTFYNSLTKNFNIADNEISLKKLKMYIPVVAILDYDGIYIHSAEENEDNEIEFTTKPKVRYTYSYVILKKTDELGNNTYIAEAVENIQDINSVMGQLASKYIYEINVTMDDYVYLNIYEIGDTGYLGDIVVSKGFYIKDNENNRELIYEASMLSEDKETLKQDIINKILSNRTTIIAKTGMREISYAVNKHNDYAKTENINYTFRFSVESDKSWYETMDGIGMIAIIQGISFGNRYLNYKAYSAADLVNVTKYYVSKGINNEYEDNYFERDLYHLSDQCIVYKSYKGATTETIVPGHFLSKADAATQGYYPCPICKP